MTQMTRWALFSPDRRYRYELGRRWDLPRLPFDHRLRGRPHDARVRGTRRRQGAVMIRKLNGCNACFIFFVWHLIPWERHTCAKGRRVQKGKSDAQLRGEKP